MGEAIISRRGGGIGAFYGDGSDGALNTSDDVTISVTSNSGIAIKQYTSITINEGHILTTDNPCRGLILYSQGDVTINGSIDMSKKAGIAPNGEIVPMVITKKDSGDDDTIKKYFQLTTALQNLKGGRGGNGGFGGGSAGTSRSTGGTRGNGRQNLGGFGGGGGGGKYGSTSNRGVGGNGGSIAIAEIGYGGGLTKVFDDIDDVSASGTKGLDGQNGGGGTGAISNGDLRTYPLGRRCYGGGGGGSGGATNSLETFSFKPQSEYAGGFVCIISGGNVVIGVSGNVSANGGNGGYGGNGVGGASTNNISGGGGGGGSGGGVIAIFHKGTFSNQGTINVDGGIGGNGGSKRYDAGTNEDGGPGESGAVGTIHIQQL